MDDSNKPELFLTIPVGLLDELRTFHLIRDIGPEGIINVLHLWSWVAKHSPSGILANMDGSDIEYISKWVGDEGVFFDAIKDKWLKINGTTVVLLGWRKPTISNTEKQRRRAAADKHIRRKKTRAEVFSKCGAICANCGSVKDITIDHIEPVSVGGKNSLDNLQPLCGDCNKRKGAKR